MVETDAMRTAIPPVRLITRGLTSPPTSQVYQEQNAWTRYGHALAAVFAVLSLVIASAMGSGVHIPAHAYSPPAPEWLALGAAAWLALQLTLAVSVYAARPLQFGIIVIASVTAGLAIFTYGRFGIAVGQGWSAWLACVSPSIPLGIAFAVLAAAHDSDNAAVDRAVRIFVVLCSIGAVYQFSTTPETSLAHLRATAASTTTVALLSMKRRRLGALMANLGRSPSASRSLWALAIVTLLVNAAWRSHAGAITPQVGIGGISIAPYFAAGLLMLVAAGVDFQQRSISRALARTAGGLALASLLSVIGLSESSTVLTWAIGFVLLVGFFAPVRTTLLMIAIVIVLAMFLKSAPGIALAHLGSPRAAERLSVWAGKAPAPDQLSRVREMVGFTGALGYAGAARPQLLVGSAAPKDYAAVVVMAQGGWAGLFVVTILVLAFLLQLLQAAAKAEMGPKRAVAVAVVVLLASNIMLTLTWLVNLSPFVGLPLPMLGRGGSHLLVGAVGLGLVHAATRQTGVRR